MLGAVIWGCLASGHIYDATEIYDSEKYSDNHGLRIPEMEEQNKISDILHGVVREGASSV